jgi:hypothetical protein
MAHDDHGHVIQSHGFSDALSDDEASKATPLILPARSGTPSRHHIDFRFPIKGLF